ncbi:MAG: hypothetical protein ACE14L_07870 [Terriglobales bacterium]
MLKYLRVLCVLCSVCVPGVALDRNAFTFARYDLQARIVATEHAISVRGRITLRNDSPVAQSAVALQISSTLVWQSVELGGKPLVYVSQPYTTDIDHTGAVTEAIVGLPMPVQPQASVELQIAYAGTIPADAGRLTRIGAPEAAALRTDWDQIAASYTAVRGVGYVCWYPVSIESVSFSDETAVFQAVGAWKQRHANSIMRVALSTVSEQSVVTNGRLVGQKAQAEAEGTLHERNYEWSPMGLVPPAFAIAEFTLLGRTAVNIYHLARHQGLAQEYALAQENILPFLTDWLGHIREKVAVVELPEGNAPFDSGAILFTPLEVPDRKSVEVAVAHQVAHACIDSPRPWIDEGLAHFAQALVRERQDGRKAAIAYMQTFLPALVSAENQNAKGAKEEQPGAGQPLTRATDEVYYRVKAMFVWWMLRDMIGDDALQHAIQSYRAADDKQPGYMQRLLEAQSKQHLESFFDDWVYRDRGLPDFRITAVYPRQMLPERVTVTVTVENTGGVAADVPVLVPIIAGEARKRLAVPAHGSAVVRIVTPTLPGEVIVNDGSIPESDMSNNRFAVKKPE